MLKLYFTSFQFVFIFMYCKFYSSCLLCIYLFLFKQSNAFKKILIATATYKSNLLIYFKLILLQLQFLSSAFNHLTLTQGCYVSVFFVSHLQFIHQKICRYNLKKSLHIHLISFSPALYPLCLLFLPFIYHAIS